MSYLRYLSTFLILLVVSSAFGSLLLLPGHFPAVGVHKQQTERERLKVKEEQLTIDAALESMRNVKQYLDSFRALTEYLYDKCDEKTQGMIEIDLSALNKIGYLDDQVQNIGFYNVITGITGTLLKQELVAKQLQVEVLKLQKADSDYVSKAELEMKASRKALDDFLKNRYWAD